MKILIVDDEEPIRNVCQRSLSKAGHAVALAATGEEAVEILKTTVPDGIVVDLLLPGAIDGFGVMERVHADPRLP